MHLDAWYSMHCILCIVSLYYIISIVDRQTLSPIELLSQLKIYQNDTYQGKMILSTKQAGAELCQAQVKLGLAQPYI